MTLHWLERILATCFLFISATCLVSLELIIASSNFISVPPETVVGAYGGSVTFIWKVSGSVLERKWKYGDTLIATINAWNATQEDISVPPSRYKGRILSPFGSPELTLTNLVFSDEGEYTVDLIDNVGGRYINSVQLIIYVYPTFGTSPPARVKSLEYKDVSLTCSINSKPSVVITWSHAGYNISNDDTHQVNAVETTGSENVTDVTSTLLLKNITSSDKGEYLCIASHYFGTFNKSTILEIHTVPFITSFPKGRIHTTESAATVNINCQVTGFPLPSVSWYKDNAVIDQSDVHYDINSLNQKYSMSDNSFINSTLTIKNVQKSDFGLYTCEALSVLYEIGKQRVNDSIHVYVNYEPSLISSPLPTLKVDNGTRITLNCTVYAFPLPKVMWASTVSTNNKRFSFETTTLSSSEGKSVVQALLRIEYVLLLDSGYYTCLSTSANVTKSWNTTLLVQWQPMFLASSMSGVMELKHKLNTTLSCAVASNPVADISWEHNQLVLKSTTFSILSSNYTMTVKSTMLTLTNASPGDSGVYSCIARNSVGESKRSIILNVLYPPILLAISSEQNISASSNGFEVSCEAKAYPPISEYKWSKDGTTLVYNESIYKVGKSNVITSQGTYKCTPRNSEGVGGTVTHIVRVQVKPQVTVPARCISVHGVLYCSCAGAGNPPLEIYWTKSPSNEILSRVNTLNISITSNVSGTYICHIKNANGIVTTFHQVTAVFSRLSEWSPWQPCNVTCGDGYTSRDRSCLIPPCVGILQEMSRCSNSSTCGGAAGGGVIQQSTQIYWHKDWYIVFWVLIPLLVILILFFLIWASRKQSSKSKAVFVSSSHSTRREMRDLPPPIRSLPTHPDIYLPSRGNTMPASTNGGYDHEDRSRLDNKEVMEKFVESDVDDTDQSFPPVFYSGPTDENERNLRWSDDNQNLINGGNSGMHLYEFVTDPPSSKEGILTGHIDAPAQFSDEV